MWKSLLIGIGLICLAVSACSFPEKPVRDGEGELAIVINMDKLAIPETHNPLEDWQKRHMQSIQKKEYTEKECISCHNIATSCNNCHNYVGVIEVAAQAPTGFEPGEDRIRQLVNGTYNKEKTQ